VRLLLVEDHLAVRAGLGALLAQAGMTVAAEAGHAREAVERAAAVACDAAVLDLRLPAGAHDSAAEARFELIGELKSLRPGMRIVVLSALWDEAAVLEALERGADAYVSKTRAAGELVRALERVSSGSRYLSPGLLPPALERDALRNALPTRPEALSERDRAFLRALSAGLTGGEIARHLGVTPKAVEHRRKRLLARLGLKSTADLIRYSHRHHLA